MEGGTAGINLSSRMGPSKKCVWVEESAVGEGQRMQEEEGEEGEGGVGGVGVDEKRCRTATSTSFFSLLCP